MRSYLISFSVPLNHKSLNFLSSVNYACYGNEICQFLIAIHCNLKMFPIRGESGSLFRNIQT